MNVHTAKEAQHTGTLVYCLICQTQMTIVKFTSSNISLSQKIILYFSFLIFCRSKERVTASRKSLTYNIYTHTNFARLALAHTVTEASHIGSWTWEVLLFRELKCTEVQQVDCARPARGIGLKQQWLVGTSRSDCARDSAAWNVYSSQTKLGQRFRVCDRLGLGQQTQSLTHCTYCNGTQAEDDYPGNLSSTEKTSPTLPSDRPDPKNNCFLFLLFFLVSSRSVGHILSRPFAERQRAQPTHLSSVTLQTRCTHQLGRRLCYTFAESFCLSVLWEGCSQESSCEKIIK